MSERQWGKSKKKRGKKEVEPTTTSVIHQVGIVGRYSCIRRKIKNYKRKKKERKMMLFSTVVWCTSTREKFLSFQKSNIKEFEKHLRTRERGTPISAAKTTVQSKFANNLFGLYGARIDPSKLNTDRMSTKPIFPQQTILIGIIYRFEKINLIKIKLSVVVKFYEINFFQSIPKF